MLASLRPLRQLTRRRVSTGASVPPPISGWNRRDALDQMKPTDAVVLDNWFPRESDVVSRKGYSLFCATGEADNVETVVEYYSGATRQFLASTNGKLLNITSGTASTITTGLSNDRWNTTMFNGRLFLVNGTDAPRDWDGTTLTTTAWTGPSSNTLLSHVITFNNRLYFVESGSQRFWYGGVGSVTGALTSFDLSQTGNFGGNLVALGIITQDGGDGVDDLFCAFMSSGEVAIYQGSYAGDANWARVGVFRIGPIVDARCVVKVGSDLLCVTPDGYLPLTKFLPFGRATGASNAISDKISQEASANVRTYGANSGWQATVYPKGRMLIINIPAASSSVVQHVMNLDTFAWCRFTGMTANCWGLYNQNLYFGGADGKVYLADTGYNDNSAAISTDGQTAWNYFGDRNRLKKFNMARPIFTSDGDPGAQIGLGTDFDASLTTATVSTPSAGSGGIWNEAVWDVGVWGGNYRTSRGWQSVSGLGYCASLRVRTSNTSKDVRWQATNFTLEPGGLI